MKEENATLGNLQEAKKGRGHGVIAEIGQMDRTFAFKTWSNPAKIGRKCCAIAETGEMGSGSCKNAVKSAQEKGKDAVS